MDHVFIGQFTHRVGLGKLSESMYSYTLHHWGATGKGFSKPGDTNRGVCAWKQEVLS